METSPAFSPSCEFLEMRILAHHPRKLRHEVRAVHARRRVEPGLDVALHRSLHDGERRRAGERVRLRRADAGARDAAARVSSASATITPRPKARCASVGPSGSMSRWSSSQRRPAGMPAASRSSGWRPSSGAAARWPRNRPPRRARRSCTRPWRRRPSSARRR